MQYENKPTMSAIFDLDVLASFAILVGMLIRFRSYISGHLVGSGGMGIEPYAFFMVAITFVSLFILFIRGVTNKSKLFIWMAVFFVLSAFTSTALSGIYPAARLPFRFVDMFYWVAVMILSYYSVLRLNTPKLHIAIVVLTLPFLSYSFFVMRDAGMGYSGTLLLNPVYFISYLMPVVLLLRSRILKVGGLLLIFVVVVLSYKRMAILAYLTSILVYFYYLSRSDSNSKIWKTLTVFMGTIMFVGVLAFSFRYLTGMFGLDWGGRMSDLVEGGGSGRFDIWARILTAFAEQPGRWLLGYGYRAADPLGGGHNDYIEVLYDFGLIGLILYLMFIGKLVSIFFEMKRLNYKHFVAFAVSLVWLAWGTMFSQLVILPYWFLSLAFFWGITIADFENAKRQAYISEIEDPLYEYQDYDDEGLVDEPYA